MNTIHVVHSFEIKSIRMHRQYIRLIEFFISKKLDMTSQRWGSVRRVSELVLQTVLY